MVKLTRFLLIIGLVLVVAACESTGDTEEDPQAAQSFFPALDNYQIQQSDDIQDAVSTTLAGAGLGTGNFVMTGVMLKVDDFIDCYREVGAFDARIYVEQPGDQLIQDGIRAPIAGVLVVVNQDRIISNFAPCLARNPVGGLRAQSVEPDPCVGNGEFEFDGNTIGYIYAATDQPLCAQFDQHFAQYEPTTVIP